MQQREFMDRHYLRAVTELGDERNIVANGDIFSQEGMKLVAAGVHISSKLYDRLVLHKLLPPLEMSLTMENAVTPESILQDLHGLIHDNNNLRKVFDHLDLNTLERHLLSLRLPAPLAFKLTVAREKYSRVYQHSLLLVVASVYLAHCDKLSLREQEFLAMAALFHDIGLLHIDPELLAPSHVMNDSERRHLYAHPLTAYLLLREFPEVPADVADAVLEHHERMDGSGYPRGVQGDRIGRLGQILAVAELAAKAFESNHHQIPWKKLEVMLKLNSRKYGHGLIGYLDIFKDGATYQALSRIEDPGHLMVQATLIAELFDDLNQYSTPGCQNKLFDLAKTRLAALRLELFEAGFDPRDPAELIQRFIDDPECMPGYEPLLREALWQFKALLLEISRNIANNAKAENPESRAQCAWLEEMKKTLESASFSEHKRTPGESTAKEQGA